jgi:hypothetical protein
MVDAVLGSSECALAAVSLTLELSGGEAVRLE